jgi:hypothetical protein
MSCGGAGKGLKSPAEEIQSGGDAAEITAAANAGASVKEAIPVPSARESTGL